MQQQFQPEHFYFTSENVTSGHPDKLCDYISDSILDACLQQDPNSKVACQTCAKNSLCMIIGEITTKAEVQYQQIVKNAIKYVGYDNQQMGLDYKTCNIIKNFSKQSQEINQALHQSKKQEQLAAGDQGIMIGYATNETQNFMPLSHDLSTKIVQRLEQCRKKKIIPWIRPDGKAQVTVQYKKQGKNIIPLRVKTILISCQHKPQISQEQLKKDLLQHVIQYAIPKKWLKQTKYVLNPSGSFIVGGPSSDAGLTGRKIIADTYGGWAGHGGGAFSGKDPTKVDRSAGYAARWISKSLVANGFCSRCMIQISYAIGLPDPISIYIDSFNTVIQDFCDHDLEMIVKRNFDLRPGNLIKQLKLKRPIYKKTCSGPFGKNDPDFTWEIIKDLQHQKKKK